MRTFFFALRLCLGFLFLAKMSVSALAQAEVHGSIGTERFGTIKTYGGDFFVTGSTGPAASARATFSRFSASGVLLWTTRLDTISVVNDFIQTDDGNFLLVGHSGDYGVSVNNRSWTASISPSGGLLAFRFYDQCPQRESFTRVARNSGQVGPNNQYVVLGIRVQDGAAGTLDWTTLFPSDASGLISSMTNVAYSTGDVQLQSALLPLASGQLVIGGNVSLGGITARAAVFDASLNPVGGRRISDLGINYINWMIEKVDLSLGSTIVWTASATSGGAVFARSAFSTGASIWAVQGEPGTNFYRILEHGGHYYVTAGVTVSGGATEFRLLRFTENAAQTAVTLDWARAIRGPETAIGFMTVAARAGGLAVVDGRTGALGSLGGEDGFFALTDLELASCETKNYQMQVAPVQVEALEDIAVTFSQSRLPSGTAGATPLTLGKGDVCTFPCEADFDFSLAGQCGEVQLTANANGQTPISLVWTWPGGSTTAVNPLITLPPGGPHNVCLTITAANNCTDTYCVPITAVNSSSIPTVNCNAPSPTIEISLPNGACEMAFLPPAPTFLHSICAKMPSDGCVRSDGLPLSALWPKGATTVTCTASDEFGATACSYQIVVKDVTKPTISCPASIVVTAPFSDNGKCEAKILDIDAAVSDNCPMVSVGFETSGAMSIAATGHASGLNFPQGTTTVTYTATDMSGNTATCSFTVTVNCACSENNCLDFDGTDDHVQLPSPLGASPTDFSVACWFRDDRNATVSDAFFYRLFGWGGANRFELGEGNGFLTFFATGGFAISTTVNVRDGLWHHAAMVYSSGGGGTVDVYFDGSPVAGMTGIFVGSAAGLSSYYRIGNWAGGAGIPSQWDGRIDEFKVWNVALTPAEIATAMNCGTDPANTNLLAHFNFDEKIAAGNNTGAGGNMATNRAATGAAFDGTLTNFTQNGAASNWVKRGASLFAPCSVGPYLGIEGNTRNQTARVSKAFNGFVYSLGIDQPTATNAKPTLTKRDAAGMIVWRHVLDQRGQYYDFVMTDDQCGLLVVGLAPTFSGSAVSMMCRVDDANGALVWRKTYNAHEREGLTRIVRSQTPFNPAFPYAVLGIRKPSGTSLDDIQLFYIDGNGAVEPMTQSLLDRADDQFQNDLDQMGGRLMLAGDVNAVGAVVFTDPLLGPTAGFPSMKLTGAITVFDIQPINACDFLVAGRARTGGGFIAKINICSGLAPTLVWAQRFPTIPEIRKVLIRPNGDIHALGWRKAPASFSPPSTSFHTIILKGKDAGPAGYLHTWAKYFYRSPETNWTLGDLIHDGPTSLFYTDSRIGNPGGYGSFDIFKAVGNDDLTDLAGLCLKEEAIPNEKMQFPIEPLVVERGFVNIQPTAGGSAVLQSLPMRDPCEPIPCACVFEKMAFSKGGALLIDNLACGASYNLGCPMQGVPITFAGRLRCTGDDCGFGGITWEVKNPAGLTVAAASSASSTYSFPLGLAELSVAGTYTITLTGYCGGKKCTCTILFTVPQCEPPCACTPLSAFQNDVNMAFNYSQTIGGSCLFQFKPKKLTACDQVRWKWAKASDLIFTTFGTTTGNASITHSFLPTGSTQYVVCIDVTRTVPGTSPAISCTHSRCVLIDVDCSLLDGGASDRGGSVCANGILQNGDFWLGSEAGGLQSGGLAENWSASAGDPEVILEAGPMDSVFIRLRGNAGYSDQLFQENLPVLSGKSQLRFAFRPVAGGVIAGSELVVRLSDGPLDSTICAGACLEIGRFSIPEDSASAGQWQLAFVNDSIEMAGKFITFSVTNPFFEDDESLKTAVDIDNVCLRSFNFVSTKDEKGEVEKADFRLFPNPTTGLVQLDWPGFSIEKGQIDIVSSLGQTLRSWAIADGSTGFEADASGLPEGIYFIKIAQKGQLLKAMRFVKQ